MNYHIRLLLFMSLAMIGVIVVFLVIVIPTVREIQNISDSIITEKKDLESKYQKGLILKKIRTELEEVQSRKVILNELYIEKGKELDFVENVENEASKLNVSLSLRLNSEDILEIGSIQKLPLHMTLDGNFIQILRYLNVLERQSYYMVITSLDITNTPGQQGDISISLIGNIYSKEYKNEN